MICSQAFPGALSCSTVGPSEFPYLSMFRASKRATSSNGLISRYLNFRAFRSVLTIRATKPKGAGF